MGRKNRKKKTATGMPGRRFPFAVGKLVENQPAPLGTTPGEPDAVGAADESSDSDLTTP